MRVLITAATSMELALARGQLEQGDKCKHLQISFHATGVGTLASAVSLTKLVLQEKPALVIQAGIAGCFDNEAELSNVFVIGSESLGDTGVTENGAWCDIFDLNLEQPDNPPFTNRQMQNPWLQEYNLLNLPVKNSITINEITTSRQRIELLVAKYQPFIESMEGAALHYVCGLQQITFIQIRATSNYIGERDKTKWKMKDSIIKLNNTLLQYMEALDNKTGTNKI